MNIQLNEKAVQKLQSQMYLIKELETKDDVLNLLVSNILCELDDSQLSFELQTLIPLEVLVMQAIRDDKNARKIKEVLGLISNRRKKRRKLKQDAGEINVLS